MKKKAYLKPAVQVVKIQHTEMLMVSDFEPVKAVNTNLSDPEKIDLGGSDEGYTGDIR